MDDRDQYRVVEADVFVYPDDISEKPKRLIYLDGGWYDLDLVKCQPAFPAANIIAAHWLSFGANGLENVTRPLTDYQIKQIKHASTTA